ncbi:hypothetical protein VP395_15180 [Mariniflexile soesokkakense]|uniref:Uncharacterized protein n=1 Tax=Mariniflexile soesokkakense TaxID=1343160 RepID=A0ABV0AHY4_9FLAO
MKTLIKQIKILVFTIVLMFNMGIYAQNELKTHSIFVRVYNLEGKKISKGSIVFINDSILGLKNSIEKKKISLKEIGFIKTKRSAGSNVLIGVLAGTTIGAIAGASSADPDDWFLPYTAGEGAVIFGGIGALGGGIIGGFTALPKKVETYIINGDKDKWLLFRGELKIK